MCLRAFILQIEISPLPKTVWELMHCFVVLFTQELVALDGLKSHVNDAGSSNFRWDVMNDRIPRLRSFSNGGQWSFLSIFFYPANLKYLWSKNCLFLIHGERMHDFRYNGNLFVFHIQHKHFKLLWFTADVQSQHSYSIWIANSCPVVIKPQFEFWINGFEQSQRTKKKI